METTLPIGARLARAVFRAARGVAQAGIASRPAMSVARMCGVRKATIFMLHRFTDGGGEPFGTDVTMLRSMLTTLRRQGLTFMRLRDLAAHVESRTELPGPTAVFTIDDGYADFAQLAAPIFSGFDCRPTVFLVTEFVSGRQWCWWDRVTEAFLRSPFPYAILSGAGQQFRYPLGDKLQRRESAEAFINALKQVPDDERRRIVHTIGCGLGVDLPAVPPSEYAALNWDQVRSLERTGVDFAPHSLTHPVLSRATAEQSADEIGGSWDVLRHECHDPSPVFGYPNGSCDSFGQREIEVVREAGMVGAVAFHRRYVDPRTGNADDRFRLSRFPVPNDPASAAYLASGMAWDTN